MSNSVQILSPYGDIFKIDLSRPPIFCSGFFLTLNCILISLIILVSQTRGIIFFFFVQQPDYCSRKYILFFEECFSKLKLNYDFICILGIICDSQRLMAKFEELLVYLTNTAKKRFMELQVCEETVL